jgi:hypothetical protein
MTGDEHLAWAKARAREYLDRGDNPGTAVASLLSDLSEHERWARRPGSELLVLLMRAFLADPSTANARRLIDRFGELNTTRLPADHCPWCGYKADAASPINAKVTPKPGDIGLCINCGSALQYGADLRLQKISDQAVRDGLSAEAYDGLMQARRWVLSRDRRNLPSRRGGS